MQNRLIQTTQTGGQQYSDTSPFSIPCLGYRVCIQKAYYEYFSQLFSKFWIDKTFSRTNNYLEYLPRKSKK